MVNEEMIGMLPGPSNPCEPWADRAPHNMTASNFPVPYMTDGSPNYIGCEPYKAFDGNLGAGQFFLTAGPNTPTGWLALDMGGGNAFIIHKYQIQVNTIPEPDRAPRDWTLEGSLNGVDFFVIDTVTGQSGWGNGEKRSFTCDDISTAYRHFHVIVTANNGDAGYLQIGEIYLWGCPP